MSYEQRIYDQARRGTAANPGLPAALASLLIAQAKHETGNFTSNAFVRHNNAFGYSYVPGALYQSGPGLIADNGQPVASYTTLENSVKEIVDWIYRRRAAGIFPIDLNSITTPEQYAQLLKNAGYYGDTYTNYKNALVKWFATLPGALQQTPQTFGAILLVGAGVALYYAAKQFKINSR